VNRQNSEYAAAQPANCALYQRRRAIGRRSHYHV